MSSEPSATSTLAQQAIQVCLCFHARKSARALSQVFDHALASTGLKATQVSLLMVVSAQEPIKIGDLADALVTDSTTVSRTLKPLLAKGLLDVSTAPKDRRTKIVRLSLAGRRMLDVALPLWQMAQTSAVRQLGGATVQTLLPGLEAAATLGPNGPGPEQI